MGILLTGLFALLATISPVITNNNYLDCTPLNCSRGCQVAGFITHFAELNSKLDEVCTKPRIHSSNLAHCVSDLKKKVLSLDKLEHKAIVDSVHANRFHSIYGLDENFQDFKGQLSDNSDCDIIKKARLPDRNRHQHRQRGFFGSSSEMLKKNVSLEEARKIITESKEDYLTSVNGLVKKEFCRPKNCPTEDCFVHGFILSHNYTQTYDSRCQSIWVPYRDILTCIDQIRKNIFQIPVTVSHKRSNQSIIQANQYALISEYWGVDLGHPTAFLSFFRGDHCEIVKNLRGAFSTALYTPTSKATPRTITISTKTVTSTIKVYVPKSNIVDGTITSGINVYSSDVKNRVLFKGMYIQGNNKLTSYFFSVGQQQVTSDCQIEDIKRIRVDSDIYLYTSSIILSKKTCRTMLGISTVQVSKSDLIHDCKGNHLFVKNLIPFLASERPINMKKSILLCSNGTVHELQGLFTLTDSNCTNVIMSSLITQCEGLKKLENEKCEIIEKKRKDGETELVIKVSQTGEVQVKTEKTIETVMCVDQCVLNSHHSQTVVVTCPGGDKHILRFSGDITRDCPFVNSYFPGRIAPYVCSTSKNPTLFYTFILFLFIGRSLVSACLLFVEILHCLINKMRVVIKKKRENDDCCDGCGECDYYKSLIAEHEACENSICPYCKNSFIGNLKKHAHQCSMKKEKIEKVMSEVVGNTNIKRVLKKVETSVIRRKINLILYVITTIILFSLSVAQVDALKAKEFTAISKDIDMFEDIEKNLDMCGPECAHEAEICTCPKQGKQKRDLYQRPILSKVKLPRGFFQPEKTFKFIESSRNIELSWNSNAEVDGQISISGNSIAELELSVDTGVTWEISSPESNEKKLVSIGIHEFYQKYKTTFVSWIPNRKIEIGSENTCTGSCSSLCGCADNTCKRYRVEGARNWGCNPGWCWGWNTGCTCCWARPSTTDLKYLLGEYRVEYLKTTAVVCVLLNKLSYGCKAVDAGSSFTIEDFEFKISKVKDVEKKLEHKIFVIESLSSKGTFDITKPDGALMNPDICEQSSCNHGEVGDFRLYDIRGILHDPDSKGVKGDMNWGASSLTYVCHSTNWPTCEMSNFNPDNLNQFETLIKQSQHLNTEFDILHLSQSIDNTGRGELNIKVRPRTRTGIVDIMMTAQHVFLRKLEVKPEVRTFEVTNCKGCRGCELGFQCLVKVSLIKPDSYSLHLKSSIKYIIVEDVSIPATKAPKSFNITLFSPRSEVNFELCFEEVDRCASVNAVLEEPVDHITEVDHVIRKKGKNDGSNDTGFMSGLSGFFTGTFSIFGGVWSFLVELIKYPGQFILLIVMIGIGILFMIYGVPILKMCLPHSKDKSKKSSNSSTNKGKSTYTSCVDTRLEPPYRPTVAEHRAWREANKKNKGY